MKNVNLNSSIIWSCFLILLFVTGCGNTRRTGIESIRSSLDSLSTQTTDEVFLKELTNAFNSSSGSLGFNGSSSMSSTKSVLNIDIDANVIVMGKELGRTAKWNTAQATSYVLWLASSRVNSIEEINVNWRQTVNKDTVYFKATVFPNKIRINWNDPVYFKNHLDTHERDSKNRLDDFLYRNLWEHGAITVNYNTASGKILKWK